MESVHPYLYFNGKTEEALAFYGEVFQAEPMGLLRFRDFGDNAMGVGEADLDRVAHCALPLTEQTTLMASDVVGDDVATFVVGNNTYIYLEAESAEEVQHVFGALADGGTVVLPLMPTEWAELHGICVDRFGVQWMLSYTGDVEFQMG